MCQNGWVFDASDRVPKAALTCCDRAIAKNASSTGELSFCRQAAANSIWIAQGSNGLHTTSVPIKACTLFGINVTPCPAALAVAVNMRQRIFKTGFPRGEGAIVIPCRWFASILNQDKARAIAEYGFEGLLPKDAISDAEGKSLTVVIYNERISSPKTGTVEFWNVVQQPEPSLERTRFNLEVVRGAHNLAFVK